MRKIPPLFYHIPAQNTSSKPNHEETEKSKLKDILQNNCPPLFTKVKFKKTKPVKLFQINGDQGERIPKCSVCS